MSPFSISFSFAVEDPKLWWPNGRGDHPLYTLGVELEIGGKIVSTLSRRVGIRKLEVIQDPDEFGRSFYFKVNTVPVFAKGANWIPADALRCRMYDSRYRLLLESAREAHMNMIRVWGGGVYEEDIFYDTCDELGLLVWQDLMFACGVYPVYERVWLPMVPDMHTIRMFAAEDQRDIDSPVMKQHQRCRADGNQQIMRRLIERWGTPASFEDFVHLSQLQQAEAIRMGVEHWRRNRNGNHCMVTLYWQLNDCWPVISLYSFPAPPESHTHNIPDKVSHI